MFDDIIKKDSGLRVSRGNRFTTEYLENVKVNVFDPKIFFGDKNRKVIETMAQEIIDLYNFIDKHEFTEKE